jgi:calcineurin-like phosphoesterase family protein
MEPVRKFSIPFLVDASFTHWGHEAAVQTFKREDGSPLRDFESAEACDEFMVSQWNAVVRPNDKVYHLGDVIMPKNHRKLEEIMPRLNGTKVLIKGLHSGFMPPMGI